MEYDLRLRAADDGDTFDWMVLTNYILTQNRSEYQIVVDGLPYAYFSYEMSLRIRMKRHMKDMDENNVGWSEPCTKQFRTEPSAPFLPPLTDISSFYIGPSETTVRLYWQQVPSYMENGPNFEYVITYIQQDDKAM